MRKKVDGLAGNFKKKKKRQGMKTVRTNVETSTGKDTRNAREDTRLVLNKTVQSVSKSHSSQLYSTSHFGKKRQR